MDAGDYGQRYDRWRSLPHMFFDKGQELRDRPLFWAKSNGTWQSMTWQQAGAQVDALCRSLRTLGMDPGERVLLIAENRPEWAIADLAIMAGGGVAVPAYTTNTEDDNFYLLQDSGAKLAIVSTPALAKRLLPAARRYGELSAIVAMDDWGDIDRFGLRVEGWDELLRRDGGGGDSAAAMAESIKRTDTSCIIYTSGTGGVPKGVMLSHGAILCNSFGAYHLFADSGLLELHDETFLSFLPLSHSYEHTAGLFFPMSIGAQIYYAESIDKLSANMAEVSPTIMTAVPRLYESMYQRIVTGVERKGGLSAKLFNKTIELGRKQYENAGLSFFDALTDKVLDKLVRAKVAARFGGRLKAFVSGGAPLNYDIGTFFHALGVRLLQGYGQTETAPVVSCNPPLGIKMHTVGPAFPAVEVKIAGDGEILVRGELTMQGYWRRPEETAEALRDGWVHTGDIGRIDEDGYIQITDRKKDIIVNSGGDNVSPQRVEGVLTLEPEVEQVMVYGDKKPHLVALIVADPDTIKAKGGVDSAELRAALGAAVDRANKALSRHEQVRGFSIAPEPFTTENEMLTPSLKIRRHKIKERYGGELEGLYGRGRAA